VLRGDSSAQGLCKVEMAWPRDFVKCRWLGPGTVQSRDGWAKGWCKVEMAQPR